MAFCGMFHIEVKCVKSQVLKCWYLYSDFVCERSTSRYAPININPKRRGGGIPRGELDNFEKLLTNSPPIGKTFVSKIPWIWPSSLLYNLI